MTRCVPEGFALVPVDLAQHVVADAHHNAYSSLQGQDRALGRAANKNRRTAEELRKEGSVNPDIIKIWDSGSDIR
ncbi:MAG: hypothetical protein V7731_08260 [Amphritea sp.]